MAQLLLVEDEPAIAEPLLDLLRGQGHHCDHAATGDGGLATASAATYDAVLLDVMLPGVDGFSICRSLRAAQPRLGILMLTAKGGEADVLEGFRAGADDYVPKPFSLAQLLARLDALLRRVGAVSPRLAIAGFHIDGGRLCIERDGRRCALIRRDIEILALMAQEPGSIVSRGRLLHEVWGYSDPDAVETRCVDMHLVKLRRRLGEAFGDQGETLIETVRGEGYRIRDGS